VLTGCDCDWRGLSPLSRQAWHWEDCQEGQTVDPAGTKYSEREGRSMYIGVGLLVVILLIVLIIYFLRRS
jgi:hypothetical protein